MTKQSFSEIIKVPDEVPTWVKYLVVKRFLLGFILGIVVATFFIELFKAI